MSKNSNETCQKQNKNSEICQQRRIYMGKYLQKQLNCAQQWCYVHMLQQHIKMSKETYLYENRPTKGPIAPSMYRLQVPALAACCSALQHVAVYCSMLQHVAICCSRNCSTLQYVDVKSDPPHKKPASWLPATYKRNVQKTRTVQNRPRKL